MTKLIGRPPKPPAEVKRRNVAFRVTQPLHDRLTTLAAADGYSVAEQVTRILETHFAAADQRTIIREEVRAAMEEHEANLAVARVRRSAALEELARLDVEVLPSADFSWLWADAKPSA